MATSRFKTLTPKLRTEDLTSPPSTPAQPQQGAWDLDASWAEIAKNRPAQVPSPPGWGERALNVLNQGVAAVKPYFQSAPSASFYTDFSQAEGIAGPSASTSQTAPGSESIPPPGSDEDILPVQPDLSITRDALRDEDLEIREMGARVKAAQGTPDYPQIAAEYQRRADMYQRRVEAYGARVKKLPSGAEPQNADWLQTPQGLTSRPSGISAASASPALERDVTPDILREPRPSKPPGGGFIQGTREALKRAEGTSGEWLARPLVSGVLGIPAGLAGLTQYLTGSEKVGKVAGGLEDLAEAWQVPDPNYGHKLISGVGSMLGFAAPAYAVLKGVSLVGSVAPTLASWIVPGSAAVLEAGTEAGSAYREVLKLTNDPKAADKAASGNFLLNAFVIGLTNKLGLFGEGARTWGRALKSAVMEGSQEGIQEILQAIPAGRDLSWKEIAEVSSIGAIIGGGGSVLTGKGQARDAGLRPRCRLERARSDDSRSTRCAGRSPCRPTGCHRARSRGDRHAALDEYPVPEGRTGSGT